MTLIEQAKKLGTDWKKFIPNQSSGGAIKESNASVEDGKILGADGNDLKPVQKRLLHAIGISEIDKPMAKKEFFQAEQAVRLMRNVLDSIWGNKETMIYEKMPEAALS